MTVAPYGQFMATKERVPLLAEAQNWRCAYCGIRCDGDRHSSNAPTCEHVIAKVDAWRITGMNAHQWENEVMACALCNNHRGHLPADEFYWAVQNMGREEAARWASRERSKLARRPARPAWFGLSRTDTR